MTISEADPEMAAALRTFAEKVAAEARKETYPLLCDVAQLLDGWHADGTAWSEWDESVRRRVSEAMARVELTA